MSNDFKAQLIDDYDTKRIVSKLLYLLTNKPKRRKLPVALEPLAEDFTSGKSKAKIGDREYTYQELLAIILETPDD